MRILPLAFVIFISGCMYGDPTIKITSAENEKLISFPEKNLKTIEAESFHGASFYPQMIVISQGDKIIKSCVRAYLFDESVNFLLSDLKLSDGNGRLIAGKALSVFPAKAYTTYPDELTKFKVNCLESYSWDQLSTYASSASELYLSFSVQVNNQFKKTYKFSLEPKYVRYSGWRA